jgi:hypothetical protein
MTYLHRVPKHVMLTCEVPLHCSDLVSHLPALVNLRDLLLSHLDGVTNHMCGGALARMTHLTQLTVGGESLWFRSAVASHLLHLECGTANSSLLAEVEQWHQHFLVVYYFSLFSAMA